MWRSHLSIPVMLSGPVPVQAVLFVAGPVHVPFVASHNPAGSSSPDSGAVVLWTRCRCYLIMLAILYPLSLMVRWSGYH